MNIHKVICTLLFFWMTPAHSSLILDIDGTNAFGFDNLVGARNVRVADRLFDIEFVEGSCISLFDNCSTFTFNSSNEAGQAVLALFNQVFLRFAPSGFLVPNQVSGCESFIECRIFVPYEASNGRLNTRDLILRSDLDISSTSSFLNSTNVNAFSNAPTIFDTTFFSDSVFVRFTEVQVSEPDTSILITLAVFLLLLSRLRHTKLTDCRTRLAF